MSRNNKGCGCSWIFWGILFFVIVAMVFGNSADQSIDIDNNNNYDNNNYYNNYDNNNNNIFDTNNDTDNNNNSDINNNNNNNTDNNNFLDNAVEPAPLANEQYDMLNDTQKAAYRTLLAGLKKGQMNYTFEDITLAEFEHAYLEIFQYSNPEFFWLTNSFSYRPKGNDLEVTLIAYNYWKYSSNPEKYVNELNAKINQIVAGGSHLTDTYDKIKYVHDYLIQNLEYDYDNLDKINNTFKSTEIEQLLSVYGALINGKCVCGGYSESFLILTRAMGIESYYVEGIGGGAEGGPHAWNYLKVDGEYYHMDVTWDDMELKDQSGTPVYPENITYTYFCITSNEMNKDHEPYPRIKTPVTTATKYNYFVREGLYFDYYDYNSAINAFKAQTGRPAFFIKFGSYTAYSQAFSELITNGKISNAGILANKQYYYSGNQNTNTITIYSND